MRRSSRPPRARSLVLAVSAAVAVPLLLAPPASAVDEPVLPGTTLVGQVVQTVPEYEHEEDAPEPTGAGSTLTWIEPATGPAVRVATEELAEDLTGNPSDLPIGATVSVVLGDEVPGTAAAEQGVDPAREVLAADVVAAPAATTAPATPPTPLDHKVTVVMMRPAGISSAGEPTLTDVVNMVNGPVRDFWLKETNGAVKLSTAATNVNWFTGTADCTNANAIWDEAQAKAGWTRGPGKHLLVYVPWAAFDTGIENDPNACFYGYGEIGYDVNSGGRSYVTDLMPSIFAHELGHNLSLGHSSAHQCDGTVETTGTPGDCQTLPYDDWYDVMGTSWWELGSLNAPQSAALGVLPAAQVQTIDARTPGAAYTLHTIAPMSGRAGTRAVELIDEEGRSYWLEYRTATGRDAWLGDPDRNWVRFQDGVGFQFQDGVQLRLAAPDDVDINTSLLLDGTPTPKPDLPEWDVDTAVLPGVPVDVSSGDLTVTVESRSGTGAKVRVTATGDSAITVAHVAAGGDGGALGAATGDEKCGLVGLGCYRTFQNATMYFSPVGGAHAVSGALKTRWAALGYEKSALGYPVADAVCGLPDTGCSQAFQGGTLVGSASTAVQVIKGAIRAKWNAPSSALGYPTSEEKCGLVGGGCFQKFENGQIYWSAASKAQVVLNGDLRTAWGVLGWEKGSLGYPVAGEVCTSPTDCTQDFQKGTLADSDTTSPQVVKGAIRTKWLAAVAELGFPTAGERCGLVGGGCFQKFENGQVYWSSASKAQVVLNGPLRTRWGALGWEKGSLGYPVAGEVCGLPGTGCSQNFQKGTLVDGAGTPVQVVKGSIRTKWLASGGAAGPLGYPSGDERCSQLPGRVEIGCSQAFEHGSIHWTSATKSQIVLAGELRDWWQEIAGERGSLGYPVADTVCGLPDTGCSQDFQGGTLVDNATIRPTLVKGSIRTRWLTSGGVLGSLGYPNSIEKCGLAGNGCEQSFENGYVLWSAATKAHTLTGPIYSEWTGTGMESGSLGYPIAEPVVVGDITSQKFQRGTLTHDAGTGEVTRS